MYNMMKVPLKSVGGKQYLINGLGYWVNTWTDSKEATHLNLEKQAVKADKKP